MKVIRRDILIKALTNRDWYADKEEFDLDDMETLVNSLGDTYYMESGYAQQFERVVYNEEDGKFYRRDDLR